MTSLAKLHFDTAVGVMSTCPEHAFARLRNCVEHANFFEARATEYSKAATKGNWNEVWDAFDGRKGAKALSIGGGAANEVDDRQGGLLGVAAE